MVELKHRSNPTPLLATFIADHPNATPKDFDSIAFRAAKNAIKTELNTDQGGLCVYCEQKLAAKDGQLEHIKPKGGKNARPDLCFTYTNYAHSCTNDKTCGQKKKDGELPIEPTDPHCNSQWLLSTNGNIEPREGLSKQQRHKATQTRDMLGLNQPALVAARQRVFNNVIEILRQHPQEASAFITNQEFRYLLATSV
ncbi:retron system putative HNH endonuclease [Cardiobacterium hominis]|uniref:TIGR02646 family protein n=1 Tax=Cardiobacterium hominis TaxID=2718 RepID=A0A1C3H6F7_9GAMM|nr:retron system putative HNH endonuclease [Cardiobacterium hominis]SAM70178.1 hypothetical protein CHUV0807_2155 [Cardiobacterium hominis]